MSGHRKSSSAVIQALHQRSTEADLGDHGESKDVVTPLPVLGSVSGGSLSMSRFMKKPMGKSRSFGSLSRLKHSGSSKNKIRPINSDYLSPVARKKRTCLMLYPEDKIKTWWEIIIVVPVLYTVTAMPLNLFFIDSTSDAWWWTDLMVTILFALDMVVQFNLAYYDNKQVLITKRTKIASNYLKTWFLVDFISLLPLDLIFSGADDSNRLLRLGRVPRSFRLLRLLRLAKFLKMDVISQLSAKIQSTFVLSKSVARFVKILLVTLLSIHLLGGIWHFIAKENESDFTWLDEADLRTASVNRRYWASAYWAFASLTSTGYGDIVAQTSGEYAFSIVVMLIGVIGGALVVADILTIVSSLDRRSGIQKSRAAAVQQLIITTRPPGHLARELLSWSEHLNKEVTELSDIMPQLPLRLRRAVVRHVQHGTIRKFPIFQLLDDDKEDNANDGDPTADLLWSCHRQTMAGESPLYVQGQPSTELYFVIKGVVQVSCDNLVLDELGEGSIVGAYDLLMAPTHTTSLDAITPCELLSLNRKHLVSLCRKYPSILRAFRDHGVSMRLSWGLDDDMTVLMEEGIEDDLAKHGLHLSAAAMATVAVQRFKKRFSQASAGVGLGAGAAGAAGDVADSEDSVYSNSTPKLAKGMSASGVFLGLKPAPPVSATVVGSDSKAGVTATTTTAAAAGTTTTTTTKVSSPPSPSASSGKGPAPAIASARDTSPTSFASTVNVMSQRHRSSSGASSPNPDSGDNRSPRRPQRLRLSTHAASRLSNVVSSAAQRSPALQPTTPGGTEALQTARNRFRHLSVASRQATDDLSTRLSAVETALQDQARRSREQSEMLQTLHSMLASQLGTTTSVPASGSESSQTNSTP